MKYWILLLPFWMAGCSSGQVKALHEEVAGAIFLYQEEYGALPPLTGPELVDALERGNPKGFIFWVLPDGYRSPDGGIQNHRGGALKIELIDGRRLRITSAADDSTEVVTVHPMPEPVMGGNAIYAPGGER